MKIFTVDVPLVAVEWVFAQPIIVHHVAFTWIKTAVNPYVVIDFDSVATDKTVTPNVATNRIEIQSPLFLQCLGISCRKIRFADGSGGAGSECKAIIFYEPE